MRKVEQCSKFRHDFKREGRGVYRSLLQLGSGELLKVVAAIANDIPLPARYRDHPLHGAREGFRECHVRPDFLLMYRLDGDDVLILERLVSHSERFGL